MNCLAGTVKSHLHRGKEKLARYFQSEKSLKFSYFSMQPSKI
jgi:DNA-directed RNA polymerase specialized sigma24 family protein